MLGAEWLKEDNGPVTGVLQLRRFMVIRNREELSGNSF